MAFCANCGIKLEEGVKFCGGCGKAVSGVSNEPVAPIYQQPAVSQVQTPMADEMYCFSCGSVIKKEAAICPKCGVSQGNQGTTDKNLPKLALVSVILLTIPPIVNFLYFRVLIGLFYITYNPYVGRYINILWNVAYIGAFVIGIIAFNKLRKNIGAAFSNTAIILFSIMLVIEIFQLFSIG